jgi:hypothetical protein
VIAIISGPCRTCGSAGVVPTCCSGSARCTEPHYRHGERIVPTRPCPSCAARTALAWLLVRIGSWTDARWDQHVRHEFGDEVADVLQVFLAEVNVPVEEVAAQRLDSARDVVAANAPSTTGDEIAVSSAAIQRCHDWLVQHSVIRGDGEMLVPPNYRVARHLAEALTELAPDLAPSTALLARLRSRLEALRDHHALVADEERAHAAGSARTEQEIAVHRARQHRDELFAKNLEDLLAARAPSDICDPPPHITHVAVRIDGIVWSLPEPYRHHHVLRLIHEMSDTKYNDADERDQGFLDASGQYLTRSQARVSATENGQLVGDIIGGVLTSEDLW